MFQRLSTDTFNLIILIAFALFAIEVIFFNGWLIFSFLFTSLIMYIGWKNFSDSWGKILFLIGAIVLFFTILNMMAVRFLLVVLIFLFFRHYQRMKNHPDTYSPHFVKPDSDDEQEPLIQIKPLFDQRMFGDQTTPNTAYEWRDINIHGGFGDRILDLGNTVLPDQSVVSIRHFIGNIIIYVPYEVEVSVHHSSIFGRAYILGEQDLKLFNQSIAYRTEGYETNYPRVKMVTSILSGDIEVRRI
ncbi:lia operon protein LiaF [Salirhabdus euzebyi]|uniref:Lia operon protein LiaF n=1 Tax=Salirhabdus euzebyi TaxID=394506 RepID=A0A841Q6C6_9BACI|nr:cell wall-active antibiotics response protein LiaF [Salirhabdus euzebyi]MBB6454069.1 lia operon protein LiaF [Salirhabdus euzebyi]